MGVVDKNSPDQEADDSEPSGGPLGRMFGGDKRNKKGAKKLKYLSEFGTDLTERAVEGNRERAGDGVVDQVDQSGVVLAVGVLDLQAFLVVLRDDRLAGLAAEDLQAGGAEFHALGRQGHGDGADLAGVVQGGYVVLLILVQLRIGQDADGELDIAHLGEVAETVVADDEALARAEHDAQTGVGIIRQGGQGGGGGAGGAG